MAHSDEELDIGDIVRAPVPDGNGFLLFVVSDTKVVILKDGEDEGRFLIFFVYWLERDE